MDGFLFYIKSSQADFHYWDNRPYKKGANGIYLPESEVISLHSGWSDMHFHQFNRPKYEMFFNFYEVHAARQTRVQSGTSTLEFSMMLNNQVINRLGSLKPIHISKDFFNITYLPFVDSVVEFEKEQFYCTMDVHVKEGLFNELLLDYPVVMEPLLNAIINHDHKRVFEFYVPCTRFMLDLSKSILQSLNRGPEYLPLIDKDVEALIAHAVTYQMETNLLALDMARMQLLNEIYNKIIDDLLTFPGLKDLTAMANTNSTTLNRMFKEAFNLTLKQCWIKYRLDTALYMLVHQRDKMISEIATEVGYSCIENFTKAFKIHFNHAPSFYRKGISDFDSIFQ